MLGGHFVAVEQWSSDNTCVRLQISRKSPWKSMELHLHWFKLRQKDRFHEQLHRGGKKIAGAVTQGLRDHWASLAILFTAHRLQICVKGAYTVDTTYTCKDREVKNYYYLMITRVLPMWSVAADNYANDVA